MCVSISRHISKLYVTHQAASHIIQPMLRLLFDLSLPRQHTPRPDLTNNPESYIICYVKCSAIHGWGLLIVG